MFVGITLLAAGFWHGAAALALLYLGGVFIVKIANKARSNVGDWIADIVVLGLILWVAYMAA